MAQRDESLGVDEHIWRPSRIGVGRAVTIMVDLTRDQDGCLHARLLDAVVGRSGTAYKTWLNTQPDGLTASVETAALDPFRGYANAIRDGLPDNKPHSAAAATKTTRSTRSAGYSATAPNTSPKSSSTGSPPVSTRATQPERST